MKTYGQVKDSIILYNGQILIGEIQNASLGAITIDDMDLKMQSIKLFKIRILKIHEPFKIETVDKKFYYGSLRTDIKDGWVNLYSISGLLDSFRITHIYQLISLESNFLKRLSGNVSAGLSFTRSSDIGQINFSANLQYSTRIFDYQLSLSSIGSIDSGKYSRDNENVQFFNNYDLDASWYLTAGLQYQRNLELSISRRLLGMVGAGNKLFIKKTWRLQATTGLTFSQEKSTEGVNSGLLFDIPFIFQFNFYKFQHPDIQINTIQTMYVSISQAGRMRYDGSTNFSWQLIRYFYLNISPYTNFDSRPPAGSTSNFDYGIVLGLSYKF